MDDYEKKQRIKQIKDSIETARIFTGAMFEALANNKENKDALLFAHFRDELKNIINTMEGWEYINDNKRD